MQNIFKHKWLEILMFLPPVILLAAVNVIGDVSNQFHNDVNRLIVDNILKQQHISPTGDSANEREVKKFLIEKMPKNCDYIAVGPSLVMYIGAESLESNSFYNLGVSGAIYYDVMAIFGLLSLNNINYKKVILCIDIPLLANNPYVKSAIRHQPYCEYTNYMINLIENKNIDFLPKLDVVKIIKNSPLFSISYFNKNIRYILDSLIKRGKIRRTELVDKNCLMEQNHTYDANGSLLNSRSKENSTKVDIIKSAKIQYGLNLLEGSVNKDFKNHFILLVEYLLKKNVEVIFWYHPIAPALWDNTNWNKYPAINEINKFSRKLAKEKGIKTVGSYNPHECGVTDDCFTDTRHLKRSAIAKYFRF